MASISILDVGHGNCTVVLDDDKSVIVDACLRDTLFQFLERHNIKEVDTILVSHADTDHIAAIPPLLLAENIHVRRIYVNPDSIRNTSTWDELRRALRQARKTRDVEVLPSLTSADTGKFKYKSIEIEIVSPAPEDALGGVGGADLEGRKLSAHSLNAVIRVRAAGHGLAFLAGDMDKVALDNLVRNAKDFTARVLVYPHHGGHAGTPDLSSFVETILKVVSPEIAVFSIGRGKHNTPRPEVISAIRRFGPSVRISCTELSKHCAATLPTNTAAHLSDEVARGKADNSCCAGTLVLSLDVTGSTLLPIYAGHDSFIEGAAPTALCRAHLKS